MGEIAGALPYVRGGGRARANWWRAGKRFSRYQDSAADAVQDAGNVRHRQGLGDRLWQGGVIRFRMAGRWCVAGTLDVIPG